MTGADNRVLDEMPTGEGATRAPPNRERGTKSVIGVSLATGQAFRL